eukprot:194255-Prorocentrum_minimum.AAC.5
MGRQTNGKENASSTHAVRSNRGTHPVTLDSSMKPSATSTCCNSRTSTPTSAEPRLRVNLEGFLPKPPSLPLCASAETASRRPCVARAVPSKLVAPGSLTRLLEPNAHAARDPLPPSCAPPVCASNVKELLECTALIAHGPGASPFDFRSDPRAPHWAALPAKVDAMLLVVTANHHYELLYEFDKHL